MYTHFDPSDFWSCFYHTVNIRPAAFTTAGRMLTTGQAAAALGFDLATVRALIDASALPIIREGRRVRIPAAVIAPVFRRVCLYCAGQYRSTPAARGPSYCSAACREYHARDLRLAAAQDAP